MGFSAAFATFIQLIKIGSAHAAWPGPLAVMQFTLKMTRFLKAKHWQLFLLMVILPFTFQFGSMIIGFISHNTNPMLFLTPVLSILYLGLFFGWFWSIGTTFHKMLPNEVKLNLNKFKIFIIIPIAYIALITSYAALVGAGIIVSEGASDSSIIGAIGIILPLHFFSMFCIFYALWFNAKTIKSVELQKPVKFVDYAGEFFLMWFFPIGIWFIQPKINKLIEEKSTTANNG